MSKGKKSYWVEQRLIGEQTWVIDASSKSEALRKVQAGEGEAVGFEITKQGGYKVAQVAKGEN